MTQWQISFPIDGLHDVIKDLDTELTVGNKVKFHYHENERVGSVIVDSDKQSDAEKEAEYLINKSLAKICFAYNTEANLGDGHYATDLTNNPNTGWVYSESTHRWSSVKEEPSTTLSKLESIEPGKIVVLDLALAYYKMGEYANPLRIESFFSCMTVLARDLLNKNPNDDVKTNQLKNSIKHVYLQTSNKFDESRFDQEWIDCYSDERCSIAHGRGSKLINSRTSAQYDKMANTVGGWARDVIYYYIDKFKN